MSLIKTGECLVSLMPQSALGCFSAYNLEVLKAIIGGAEKAGRPAIVSLDPHHDHVDFESMACFNNETGRRLAPCKTTGTLVFWAIAARNSIPLI